MKVVTAYRCEHCEKKILISKSGMYKHEAKCFANPVMKACRTCSNYTIFDREVINTITGDQMHDGCNYFKKSFQEEGFKFKHFCKGWKPAEERNW